MAWMHSYSLDNTLQDPSSSLIPQSEDLRENLTLASFMTHSPLEVSSTSSYGEDYINDQNVMPSETHFGGSGLQYEMHAASLTASPPSVASSVITPHLLAPAVTLSQLPSAATAVTEEAEQSATSHVAENGPVIKVRKNKLVLGELTLAFQCNGQDYIRLSDHMLEQDLQTMYDPEYRGFFDGLGEKVTYVIAFHSRPKFVSKQRYCRQTYQGVTLYFTRKRIAREVAQVIRDFLQLHPDFYIDGAFHEWSMFSTIDNMALVGLRKISRASIQIFLTYCSPPPTQIGL